MKSYLRLIPHATPGVLRTRRRSQRQRCANDDEKGGRRSRVEVHLGLLPDVRGVAPRHERRAARRAEAVDVCAARQ